MAPTFTNKKLLEKFKKRIDSISGPVLIISDTDTDGISSAALLHIALKNHNPTHLFHKHTYPDFTDKEIADFEKYDTIFVLDLPLEIYPSSKKCNPNKFIIIDHHEPIESDFLAMKGFFLQDEIPGDNICTTSLVYHLFPENHLPRWIAALGIFGDQVQNHEIETSQSNKLVQQYVPLFDIFHTLGKDYDVALNALLSSNTIEDAAHKLSSYQDNLIELNTIIKNVHLKKGNGCMYAEIESSADATKFVSNKLKEQVPNEILILLQKQKEFIKLSGRNHNETKDVRAYLLNITKDLPGAKAGGHIHASGATVPLPYYEELMRRLS